MNRRNEKMREDWAGWFRVVYERAVKAGKSDEQIVYEVLMVKRPQVRRLMAKIRAEHADRKVA